MRAVGSTIYPYLDFVEKMFDSGKLDGVIQDLHWSGGYDEKVMLEQVEGLAEKLGVKLVGKEDFDAEVLKDIYDCSEKGLS